jgi:two-component system cell cycle sensor histidine kinase/response regulator CckA
MNLAVNSRDAMPDGGVLSIETEEAEIGAEAAREPVDAAPGEYVRLTIRDTGIGMNGEVLSHVFEPFFATRERAGARGWDFPQYTES